VFVDGFKVLECFPAPLILLFDLALDLLMDLLGQYCPVVLLSNSHFGVFVLLSGVLTPCRPKFLNDRISVSVDRL